MIKVLELFGGIGACTKALKRLNIPIEVVDYVEIDKFAVASYNAINGTNFEVQDVRRWNKNINVDLIMHGSPCQDFSLAGRNAGGDEGSGTRSSLMFETLRIVKKLKPKYIIWENVKNVISKTHKHNFESYINQLRILGYQSYYQLLNAKDYGIPQNRERLFVISIRSDVNSYGCHVFNYNFPKEIPLSIKLKDLLEDEVDKKYYLSDKMKNYIFSKDDKYIVNENMLKLNREIACSKTTREGQSRADTSDYILVKNNTKQGYLRGYAGDGLYINPSNKRGVVQHEIIPTITTFQDKGVILEDLTIRRLTPKECWRLMGFDDDDFEKASKVNSDTQLYKQAGNSIVVNVLENILINLIGANYENNSISK